MDVHEEIRNWREGAIRNSDDRLMRRLRRMEADKEPKGTLWVALFLVVAGAFLLAFLNWQYLQGNSAPRISVYDNQSSTNETNTYINVTNVRNDVVKYAMPEGENLVCLRSPGAKELSCKWIE